MGMVQHWSGREVRALREARRMSVREFAAHLGISDRMVSKWEAGGTAIGPRPINQAALDTSLKQANGDAQSRFSQALNQYESPRFVAPMAAGPELPAISHVEHPIDGKLMTLIRGGEFLCGPDNTPVELPDYRIDVYPTTNQDYARFVAATGYERPQHWNGHTCPDALLNHPVVFVTWHDAVAYAQWAGKALPTSEQ